MRGVQMHNGGSAGALLVHGAVEESLFRRRVAADEIAFPVELGDAPRVEPAETTVGGRQEPAVVEAHADIAAAAAGEAAVEDGFPEQNNLFAESGLGMRG